MIKIFLLLFFITSFLNAANSTAFSDKQELLMKVKTIIQEEESIARAYENFINNENKLPTTFNELLTDDYLGSLFTLTSFDTSTPSVDDFGFKKQINSRLKNTTLEDDTSVKAIYESDLFRKKTFFYNSDTIGIKLEDEFVKHLYFLSSTAGFNLIKCDTSPKRKYCWGKDSIDENNIYIYSDDAQTQLLMYYAYNMYNTGPIIITNDTSLHITSDEFNSIPRGALLYDTEAVKYIKTTDSLEVVK
ncbi:MAG: hypothetical protein ACPG9K_03195 [Poseidonibacter sp.]